MADQVEGLRRGPQHVGAVGQPADRGGSAGGQPDEGYAALPSMAHKLTAPMLREALQAKGLESSDLKDALVDRLKQAVSQ